MSWRDEWRWLALLAGGFLPWPPEPLRFAAASGIRGYLQLEDWYYERGLNRS